MSTIVLKTRQERRLSELTVTGSVNSGDKERSYSTMTAQELIAFKNNRKNILSMFPLKKDRKEAENQLNSANLKFVVPTGTSIEFPSEKVSRNLLYKFNNRVVDTTSFNAFLAKELESLLNDNNYKQVIETGTSSLRRTFVFGSVIVWSKNTEEFVDISNDVISLNTSTTGTGGTFSIVLHESKASYDEGGKITQSPTLSKSLRRVNSGDRGKNYYENLLQKDDVVFIRASKLDNEKQTSNQVAGQIYDMIGTVDVTSMSYSGSGGAMTLNISGRDLTKLLVEDGTYFFTFKNTENKFLNDPNGILSQRARVGISNINQSSGLKSIEDMMKFIIAKYSTSGMIPHIDNNKGADVFDEWGDRRTKVLAPQDGDIKAEFEVLPDGFKAITNITQTPTVEEKPAPGLWSLISFVFDESIRERTVTDMGIGSSQGSVMNAIKRVCQSPFVEFFGDTYGDKYYFTARKPIIDKKGAIGFIDGQPNSEPLPFARQSQLNALVKKINSGEEVAENRTTGSGLVIDINELDVISESLSWDTTVYSWYQVELENRSTSFGEPAVSFDEYAQAFGVRSLTHKTMYTNTFNNVRDSSSTAKLQNIQRQLVNELKYVVQSNAYLPFTRRGQIVIELNRTIKRGTWIYYAPTDEVYYVDSVAHATNVSSGSASGRTTLTLFRGMRYGGGTILRRYFDLINFGEDQPTITKSVTADKLVAGWRVNTEIFEYFLKRKQWQ